MNPRLYYIYSHPIGVLYTAMPSRSLPPPYILKNPFTQALCRISKVTPVMPATTYQLFVPSSLSSKHLPTLSSRQTALLFPPSLRPRLNA